jgi:hypothetical protein
LVVYKGALILPSSTEFCWQDAWMNEDVENFYGFYIITSGFKTEFTRESQVLIVRFGSQRGLAKPLKKSSKSWLMLWSMDMVEAASP